MNRWLSNSLVQIALCVAAYALVAIYLGKVAFLVAAPLFAVAVARPIYALVADIRYKMRERVWLPVHGEHYVYKGITIHVLEDDDRCRWVCLADVRKVVPSSTSELTMAVTYAGRVQDMGRPPQAYIRDDALLANLAKESEQPAIRFRNWVQRNIALPAQNVRSKLGIKLPVQGPADTK